jgi:uncharacterized protein (DUF1501 family)
MTWDVSRRVFLKGAGLAALGVGAAPSGLLERVARASSPSRNKVLVHVFLRGGVDGLCFVAPYGDPDYYRHRPQLALQKPGRSNGVVALDDHFGLHPALAPLHPLFAGGRLAAVHAVGNYSVTRSHFSAQDFVELGTPGVHNTTTGTLARMSSKLEGSGVMKQVAFSANSPLELRGPDPSLVTLSLSSFELPAKDWLGEAERRIGHMYKDSPLSGIGADIFGAIKVLKSTPALGAPPANGADYPVEAPGAALRQAATLVKAGVGTRCIFVPVGGHFDTHSNQADWNRLEFKPLARALAAFAADLGPKLDDVVVLVTTEFGRTVFMNGSAGTDHGTGFCALVLGGSVRGGQVYGRWPGLAKSQLFEERDLAVTTDFRGLFTEIAVGHVGVRETSGIFPDYTSGPPLGLFS